MPKTAAQARPADLKRTVRRLLSYMGHAKFSLLAVGVLASVAAIASLAGTYMVRPIVNGLATGGEELLAKQVILTAIIYAAGVLSALGYSQIMVRAAQHVVSDIRRDLFAHIQTLPLSYFDSTRSGDIMSFFTNDVDTVSEALNNSFANVIQAAIQVVGTTAMLIILNWQLTIITLVCDAAIVLYARYSGARSKRFFAAQQASLGDLDGYIEEMVSGQKVIKVFNREAANVAGFTCRNDELRRTGTAARELCQLHGAHDCRDWLRQLCHRRRGGRHALHQGARRRRCARELPGLCAPGRHAHQPVYAARQLLAQRVGRCRAPVCGYGP